ncbi:MAG: hypothetical protein NVSMB17_10780 [Candidatus Dormibacteria bacterium]
MAALSIVVLSNNPVYRGLVALLALNYLVARHRPEGHLAPLLKALAVFSAFAVVYNPLISHGGSHRIAALPTGLPAFGGAITLESVAFGLSAAVGFVAAALSTAPLFMVMEPGQLVDVLPRRLHGTAMALGGALNLVPGVARSYRRVRDAESLRGSGRKGPRALVALVVPVALTTIESSITLAEAMEARGYGPGPRTRRCPDPRGARTAFEVALATGAGLLFLGCRLAQLPLDWYPFPALTFPGVQTLAVLSCLLLGATLVPLPRLGGARPPVTA